MADYKETTVSGTTWTRALRVQVDNPYGGIPAIMFTEEEVTKIGEKNISQLSANLSCSFDSAVQLHVDIYTKLNELYVLLREARDNG